MEQNQKPKMDRRLADFAGIAGEAWRTDTNNTCLANWLLFCPGAHPFWWWYTVSVISLADVEGVAPAEVRLPGAKHEIGILALDPKHDPDPEKVLDGYPWLSPPNLMEQFVVPTDANAITLGEGLVRAFVNGQLTPDTDGRRYQEAAIAATSEHFRLAGQHPDVTP